MAEIAPPQGRILIVDGDAGRRRQVHAHLFAAGFDPAGSERLEQALALCRAGEFDLVLVVPGPAKLRAAADRWLQSGIHRAAVLMLTEGEEPDRIAEVLEAGVDQCLPASICVMELAAHVRAILRQTGVARNSPSGVITIGEVRLDPVRRTVSRGGAPVHLTVSEFGLLHCLMTHAGIPLTHEALLSAIRGDAKTANVAYLRVTISRLRRKLNDHISPRYLLTHSCIGYVFAECAEAIEQDQASSVSAIAA